MSLPASAEVVISPAEIPDTPTGVCCFHESGCEDEIPAALCEAVGGLYKGEGTECLGDNNGDGIDDACEACELYPARSAPYPHNRLRNRYIAFDPNKAENGAVDVSFKITLVSLVLGSCDDSGTPDVEGWACRTDDDCRACSTYENACWNAAINCVPNTQTCDLTGATCVNDQAASIGQSWWVGVAHPTTGVRLAVTETHALSQLGEDWEDAIVMGDCEMVPYATYEVRTVDASGGESDPLKVFTTPAPGFTNYWADCVGPLGNYCTGNWAECPNGNSDCLPGETCVEQWPPPDGFISFNDVSAAVFTFSGLPTVTATDLPNVDIHGSGSGNADYDPPNYLVTFDDIGWMIKAFKGYPYPFNDPADCPDVGAWP